MRTITIDALLLVVFAGSAEAVQPGPTQFPLLGIGRGQTLRLNAVAGQPGPISCGATLSFADRNGAVLTNPGPVQNPSIAADADAGPCLVTMSFVDATGAAVGVQPGPIQITPGQTASHYFLSLPPTIGPRVNVRPVVAVDSVPGMLACAGLTSAAETFDLFTGRTWVISNPGPQQ